jgi:hypothetical protein
LGLNVETSCLAAAVDTRLTSGFLNVNFGTGEAYTVPRQVIRVRLGVCARQGNLNGDGTPLYSAQYVQQTGISSALIFNAYSDAACATVPLSSSTVVTFNFGYSLITNGFGGQYNPYYPYSPNAINIAGNSLYLFSNINHYATITYDAGYNAFPALEEKYFHASAVTWVTVSVYANAAACAQPTSNPPIFTYASASYDIFGSCPSNLACADTNGIGILGYHGSSASIGCVNVIPQTSGTMMVTQWTGGDPQQVKRLLNERHHRQIRIRMRLENERSSPPPLTYQHCVVSSARGPSPMSRWWRPLASALLAPPKLAFPPLA